MKRCDPGRIRHLLEKRVHSIAVSDDLKCSITSGVATPCATYPSSLTPGESRMASSGHLARPTSGWRVIWRWLSLDDHHAVVAPDLDPVADVLALDRVARRAESHRLQPVDLTLFRRSTARPASLVAATRADESSGPAHQLQVIEAVRIGGEPGLELAPERG